MRLSVILMVAALSLQEARLTPAFGTSQVNDVIEVIDVIDVIQCIVILVLHTIAVIIAKAAIYVCIDVLYAAIRLVLMVSACVKAAAVRSAKTMTELLRRCGMSLLLRCAALKPTLSHEYSKRMMRERIRRAKWDVVRRNGMNLKTASRNARNDYGLVLAAIEHNPTNFRFADKKLKDDEGLKKAAKVMPMRREVDRIVLSKRFALGEASSEFSTRVILALRSHEYFKHFTIYNPDSYNKGFCGPKRYVTSLEWPCRGTEGTCASTFCMADGHPTPKSCWRYSYRWHEMRPTEEANVQGFLLQIREFDMNEYKMTGRTVLRLGDGQRIEEEMARAVALPIYVIDQCDINENENGVRPSSIDALAQEVRRSASGSSRPCGLRPPCG